MEIDGTEFNIFKKDLVQSFVGNEIKSIKINEEPKDGECYGSFVFIRFSDDSRLELFDENDCCESRYMMTDDDISSLDGDKFRGIELKSCQEIDDGGDVHEACFMEIQSDKSFITICCHNEHSGFYSGFNIEAKGEFIQKDI